MREAVFKQSRHGTVRVRREHREILIEAIANDLDMCESPTVASCERIPPYTNGHFEVCAAAAVARTDALSEQLLPGYERQASCEKITSVCARFLHASWSNSEPRLIPNGLFTSLSEKIARGCSILYVLCSLPNLDL